LTQEIVKQEEGFRKKAHGHYGWDGNPQTDIIEQPFAKKWHKATARSKREIQIDILRLAMSPILQTNLMYAANVNYVEIKRHLRRLFARGLVILSRDGGYHIVQTSDKGKEVLFHAFAVHEALE
jgi:predicted transcriptional regulator